MDHASSFSIDHMGIACVHCICIYVVSHVGEHLGDVTIIPNVQLDSLSL